MQLVTPEAESEPTVDTDLAAEVFFYAVERHTWTRDALYRVYLKDRHVAGAWVAGPVRDAASCQLQYGGHWTFNWLLRRILKKALAQRIERERFYNEINPFADGFLELDRRNFQFSGSDIRRIRVKYERVNDVPGSAGTVEIDTLCGARHKLIVLGGWLPDELVNRLRLLDRGIEVEGADAFRTPAEHNAFYQRHSLTNQAVACFGLAPGPRCCGGPDGLSTRVCRCWQRSAPAGPAGRSIRRAKCATKRPQSPRRMRVSHFLTIGDCCCDAWPNPSLAGMRIRGSVARGCGIERLWREIVGGFHAEREAG